jgi:Mce-associated membrane protein
MSEQQVGKDRPTQPVSKEIIAVQSDIDTSTERDEAQKETTELVEGETAALSDNGDAEENPSDDQEADQDVRDVAPVKSRRRINRARLVPYALLPVMALLLAVAAGYLKWQDSSARNSGIARIDAVAAAKDATIAMLSYQPDTAERDLGGARDRLTGTFKESYTQLTHDVVIPGAKQKHITAVATVPAVASVSATPNHAVVLLFANQTIVVGTDAPSGTVSSVRVTLDKINDRWLVSEFDPI